MRREPRAPLREAFEAGVDADDLCRASLDERERQSCAPAAGVEYRAGPATAATICGTPNGGTVSRVRAPVPAALPVFAGLSLPAASRSVHPAGAGAA